MIFLEPTLLNDISKKGNFEKRTMSRSKDLLTKVKESLIGTHQWSDTLSQLRTTSFPLKLASFHQNKTTLKAFKQTQWVYLRLSNQKILLLAKLLKEFQSNKTKAAFLADQEWVVSAEKIWTTIPTSHICTGTTIENILTNGKEKDNGKRALWRR